jgi:hypothetical protein
MIAVGADVAGIPLPSALAPVDVHQDRESPAAAGEFRTVPDLAGHDRQSILVAKRERVAGRQT